MNPKKATQVGSTVKTKDQASITDDMYFNDAETNTSYKKGEISIQTDPVKRTQEDNSVKVKDVDLEKLAAWMEEKYMLLKPILDANNERGTFSDYEVRWDEENDDITEQYALRTHFDFRDANIAV